jgi:methylglutaconyl-CoA hydratase
MASGPADAAPIRVARDARGVVTLTLDRPERRNAFDDRLIAALARTLAMLAAEPGVRALVLTGAGTAFSAGADLDWMRRAADYGEAENLADARALEAMLASLDAFPRPTVARVNGAAIGGGVGLVAACDIAVAAEGAVFAMSEVRLGLLPAVVAPFVGRAVGERACRRLFLTAERFDAAEACRLGLVHEVVAETALDGAVAAVLGQLLEGGPEARAATKALLRALRDLTGDAVAERTTQAIARARASAEGREGVRAFLEKRRPAWPS